MDDPGNPPCAACPAQPAPPRSGGTWHPRPLAAAWPRSLSWPATWGRRTEETEEGRGVLTGAEAVPGPADRSAVVTSAEAGGPGGPGRHRMSGARSASARTVPSVPVPVPVPVPVGRGVALSPNGLDVTVPANADGDVGDLVAFVPHFERGGPARGRAAVDRPGSGAD